MIANEIIPTGPHHITLAEFVSNADIISCINLAYPAAEIATKNIRTKVMAKLKECSLSHSFHRRL